MKLLHTCFFQKPVDHIQFKVYYGFLEKQFELLNLGSQELQERVEWFLSYLLFSNTGRIKRRTNR